jgi:hypothetical protein
VLPDGVRAGDVRRRIADDGDLHERQLRDGDEAVRRLRLRFGHESVFHDVHERQQLRLGLILRFHGPLRDGARQHDAVQSGDGLLHDEQLS